MNIKNTLVKIAEKITGRKCCRCHYNVAGRCCHPDGNTFCRCWQSITRPGFTEKRIWPFQCPKGEPGPKGMAPGDLTEEEKYQLGKIVENLQEASATAQDAGLLGEDDQETDATRRMRANLAARNIWEDKTESGLLED